MKVQDETDEPWIMAITMGGQGGEGMTMEGRNLPRAAVFASVSPWWTLSRNFCFNFFVKCIIGVLGFFGLGLYLGYFGGSL